MVLAAPRLTGAYAPILTPFAANRRSVDTVAFRHHLKFLDEAGLTGVVILGTNGEFIQLDADEKLALVEATLSAGTSLELIVGGTAAESPAATLSLLSQLRKYQSGVSTVLLAPPFYQAYAMGASMSEAAVVDFYRQVAGRLPNRLKLLLYNVPVSPDGPVTAPVTPRVVAALRDLPAIVGIKEAVAHLATILAYRAAFPNLKIFVGNDHLVSGGLMRGGAGSITAAANVFPSAVLKVYQAESDARRAAAQAELSALRRVLDLIPGKLVATQKLLLAWLEIVPQSSPVRDRRLELRASEKAQVWNRLLKVAATITVNVDIRAGILELGAKRGLPD